MTETTIGYAVLQIIPSLKGVSEAIEKQIAGQVVSVTIEPKTDAAKVDKSIKDAVKKKPVEVQIEPKIDKSKIDAAVKDSVNESKPPEIPVAPKIDTKKLEQTIGDAVKKTRNAKLELPEFDTRGLGAKLRGAVVKGLEELNNNPALKDIQEQIGEELGKAVGEKIGEAIGNSRVGEWARAAAEQVQTVTDSLHAIKQGDAAGGLNGIADALNRIGQNGAATQLHNLAGEVQPLQDKFGALKGNIEGTTNNLLGLTNNSGKIAGGLNAIAGAAGPLAAVFTVLTTLMPGFNDSLNRILAGQGGWKDWVHMLNPATGILDELAKPPPANLPPVVPNLPTTPGGIPRPGLIPGSGGGQPPTVGGIPIPGLVPAGPPGAAGTPPRPGASGAPVVPGSAAPSGFLSRPGKAPEGGLQINTIKANRAISAAFPEIQTIGGVRADALKWHPQGLALDIMIPGQRGLNDPTTPEGLALGNRIWAWMAQHAQELGIDMGASLWQQRDHYNHIHLATTGGGYPKGGEQYQLPSFDTGTDGPLPKDTVALLHKGEVVVPADEVEAAQRAGGSSGGFSLPTSLGDLAGFGLNSLGQGIGATRSGSDLSLFGQAAGAAVSGQVSSALDSFGVPGAPRWLGAISKFVSGISIGGPGGGGGANPMSAAMPAAASLIPTPAAAPDSVHSVGAMQRPGPTTIFNIRTATVEDAFVRAQKDKERQNAAKLDRWT